ncbi:MAG: FAD-dependent oxidoreductase, partial [Pseudomonadota bacterium]
MTHSYDYDFFVIGGGSGGVRAARIAGSHGAKVGLAEGADLGGTCVNIGCVPKKLFVYASKFSHVQSDAKGYGWNFLEPNFDWKKLIENKDTEINRIKGFYESILTNNGVILHRGYAKFIDDHIVEVNEERIT